MPVSASQKISDRFQIKGERYDIPASERDRALLLAGSWPNDTETSVDGLWASREGHLFRKIAVSGEGENSRAHNLWEALLPFPNSPVYATHRYREHTYKLPPWANLHTMRVIGRGEAPGAHIKHVYLLHNGLNETTDLLFHYRLAAWILGKRPDAVCILRPLPGHLTRFPFSGSYAELPLDTYLRDPASLFRQFLRYMQETQWLLSALAPRPHYAVAAGTRLLAEKVPSGRTQRPGGRADTKSLARAITGEWTASFQNTTYAEEEREINPTHSKQPVTRPAILSAVRELRQLLNWQPVISTYGPTSSRASGRPLEAPEPPGVHVVGYSMGGFMAQAVFFAWPFAVSSCTNLFAGGALRDLAPTAFAHPEEWQAVLHGMRYELDRAFREQYLTPSDDGRIAGIAEADFGYFARIFYEVYLQYYRGGYASRVAEFSRRMLFVVGGDDPIVRTKNVLDAGPPQGMTLLQIADVSHFPGRRPPSASSGGSVESEQRKHWLPEVGRIIANFSEQSEGLLHRTLVDCWGVAAGKRTQQQGASAPVGEMASPTPQSESDPTMLASAEFAKELGQLIECSEIAEEHDPKGWLLIGRNELSPVFLGPAAMRFYAQAIHHSEDQIAHYVRVLSERAERLRKGRSRVSLLIPERDGAWFSNADLQTFFARSETPSAARIPSDGELEAMWGLFEKEWLACGAAGIVTPGEHGPDRLGHLGAVEAERLGVAKIPLTILPDVWIALSDDVCGHIRGAAEDTRRDNEDAVVKWATMLTRDDKKGLRELQELLDSDDVIAITVSGAELNPRYRGHRLVQAKDVRRVIVHWSLAYCASDMRSKT